MLLGMTGWLVTSNDSAGAVSHVMPIGGRDADASHNFTQYQSEGHLKEWTVNILEMLRKLQGNCYMQVFTEYLTEWVEAYPTKDQTSGVQTGRNNKVSHCSTRLERTPCDTVG